MKIAEKISLIQDKNFGEWLKVRSLVRDEISGKQAVFCLCGRLATGFHENGCKRFNNKVNSEAAKRLEHLIK